jgi:type IV pilus assembly protein PilN
VIKINLLPQKRRTAERAEGSQLWLGVVLLVFLAEVAGLFVFHGFKNERLGEQVRVNRELQAQIDQAKKAVQNHGEVKGKLEQLRAKEDAIGKLQSARTGPTAVLLELARILTPNRGPTVDPDRLSQLRRENPLAVFNPGWDARRLWLTKFVEQQRKVRLEGLARDGEDVSELARRLSLSSLFYDVKLLPAKKQRDAKLGLDLVTFQLEAQVRY